MLTTPPPAGTTAFLTTPAGQVIGEGPELCVVTPATYRTTDTVYGPTGRSILTGANGVLVIGRAFVSGTYSVRLVLPGQGDVAWSFRVAREPEPPASVTAEPGEVSARVSWAASTGGGAPTSYTVEALPDRVRVDVDGATTSVSMERPARSASCVGCPP